MLSARAALLFLCALLFWATDTQAQLRVVQYNTAGDARSGIGDILQAIGAESVNGIAKPIDVLALQEQDSSATTTAALVDVLNGIYGPGTYARATLDGATTGAGRTGLIYRTSSVSLIEQTTASTTGSTGAARQSTRYELRPVGYSEAADFYVYVSHYKSSDDSVSRSRRQVEAQQVRSNADALGSAHIIYAGDFNIYNSSEAMYQTLLSPGAGQAFDPLNRPGNWSNQSAFKDVHTQSPVTSSRYGGQVTGGVDDRFDFQVVTAEMLDSEGLSYIAGSYHAWGNTGTHTLNGEITSGSAAALQSRLPGYTLSQASGLLTTLANVSDHLPVVADYQLPAKMTVAFGATPSRVLVGADVSIDLTVSNSAAVVAAIGADELDYNFSTSGGLIGTGSGTDEALGYADVHQLTLATGQSGSISGSVRIRSTSQAAANPDQTRSVTVSVLEHARPSFGPSEQQTSLVVDFGTTSLGEPIELSIQIANLLAMNGFTSGLDLDQLLGEGDTQAFTVPIQLFNNLTAGASVSYELTFTPFAPGDFVATYRLFFSDEDLPGEQSEEMTLTLQGVAIPEPSTIALGALGMIILSSGRALRGRQLRLLPSSRRNSIAA